MRRDISPGDITPVIQPLYRELFARMCAAGLEATGPGVAYYDDSPARAGSVVMHAAVQVAAGPGERGGCRIVDLPEVQHAATIIHPGTMDEVLPTGKALARWIDASGYRSAGYARELTVNWSPDPAQWVTELQQPIHSARFARGTVHQEDDQCP